MKFLAVLGILYCVTLFVEIIIVGCWQVFKHFDLTIKMNRRQPKKKAQTQTPTPTHSRQIDHVADEEIKPSQPSGSNWDHPKRKSSLHEIELCHRPDELDDDK